MNFQRSVPSAESSHVLPAFAGAVETCATFQPRPEITHVVFDFDGTLSWIRHGWPALMLEVFHKRLGSLPPDAADEWTPLLAGIVWGMNGRPTLAQMTRFAEEMRERRGEVLSPPALLKEFQDELDTRIAERLLRIRSGEGPEAFVVHGARPLLEYLRELGLTLVILSSTIEHRVREEAQALQLSDLFGRHIYGSPVDPREYSKRAVLERLCAEDGITGRNLLSFGDGPVEIAATKELGGLAIAVCTDEEHNGSGVMDDHKKAQLLSAGADAAIPDFRDAIPLMKYLLAR